MTDLELTKACAEAMGYEIDEEMSKDSTRAIQTYAMWNAYDPLGNDAQAMALVKKFKVQLNPQDDGTCEATIFLGDEDEIRVIAADLNRAICECVAKIKPE